MDATKRVCYVLGMSKPAPDATPPPPTLTLRVTAEDVRRLDHHRRFAKRPGLAIAAMRMGLDALDVEEAKVARKVERSPALDATLTVLAQKRAARERKAAAR